MYDTWLSLGVRYLPAYSHYQNEADKTLPLLYRKPGSAISCTAVNGCSEEVIWVGWKCRPTYSYVIKPQPNVGVYTVNNKNTYITSILSVVSKVWHAKSKRQTAVAAYFPSEQLLLFVFAMWWSIKWLNKIHKYKKNISKLCTQCHRVYKL